MLLDLCFILFFSFSSLLTLMLFYNPSISPNWLLLGPPKLAGPHPSQQLAGLEHSGFFQKWANPGLFYSLFSVFSNEHHYNFTTNTCEKVHPVYGAGIWTHNLRNTSLLSGLNIQSYSEIVFVDEINIDTCHNKLGHSNCTSG